MQIQKQYLNKWNLQSKKLKKNTITTIIISILDKQQYGLKIITDVSEWDTIYFD